MIRQYPYSLYVQVLSEDSQPNDRGEYTESAASWELLSICRDESNSGGQRVTLPDSTTVVFDSVVYLPIGCPAVADGTPIRIMDGETLRVAGNVLRFQANQLNCRLWV